jgi:hypothetical protein
MGEKGRNCRNIFHFTSRNYVQQIEIFTIITGPGQREKEGLMMGLVEQAEMVKQLTGSSLEDRAIMFAISTLSAGARHELCLKVDRLVKDTEQPFRKAYPEIEAELRLLAAEYQVDLARLCWMYLRWLCEN